VLSLGCLFLSGTAAEGPGFRRPARPGAEASAAGGLSARRASSPGSGGRVDLVDEREAWKHLPAAVRGARRPLPAWARALAPSLPRTTAAMLKLDYLHRAAGPLEPALRGRIRWVVAHANRCRYSEEFAEADLRRAGLGEAAIRALGDARRKAPPAEKAALTFADKLTRAAHTVTDEEVGRLIGWYGEGRVVAMVLLVAYGNFQDRLVLALGLPPEAGGSARPEEVCFERGLPGVGPGVSPRRGDPAGGAVGVEGREAGPGWGALDLRTLRGEMDRQRDRTARIRLPAAEAGENRWGLVCRAYQPELAAAWSACTHAFEEEADPDPVLTGSLFWVVTRSQRCFY
jgi:alkylhydroperoxidase family enzyme